MQHEWKRRETYRGYWLENQNEKKNVDIDGRIILKRTLEKCGGVV
jgi:hypothetical protein